MSQARQLAAIMFTDIVGYTRLMGQSEEKALVVLQQNRAVQKPLIAAHNGRFIKELGDGTMASFDKASDAVRCAIGIQKASKEFPDLDLRIGIHLGEVVFENDDVFGDGVNIAARIESAGKAGAIYISGAVHGTVHNRDDIETRFVERMQLKNVSRPIEIHEVAVDGVFSGATPKAAAPFASSPKRKRIMIGAVASLLLLAGAYSLWGRKATGAVGQVDHASIAVLPFANMSSDTENEFFCDGVTEDILTKLSQLKNLKVISRTSVMHFKGTTLSIPEIAEQLGVDYILEGSVRKQGDQVAITAQLIHAADDGHLWAENYERSLENVFSVQREVAQEIARVLNIKISVFEKDRLKRSATGSLEAYQYFLKAREAANDRSKLGVLESIDLLTKAVEADPLYADAYAAWAYSTMLYRYQEGPMDSCENVANALISTALEIDPNNAQAYITRTEIFNQHVRDMKQLNYREPLLRAAEKAVELGPNSADAYFKYSQALGYASDAPDRELALAMARKAAELDPFASIIKNQLIFALTRAGKLQEAWDVLEAHRSLIVKDKHILGTEIELLAGLHKWAILRTRLWQSLSEYENDPNTTWWYMFELAALQSDREAISDVLRKAKEEGVTLAPLVWADLYASFGLIPEAEALCRGEKGIGDKPERERVEAYIRINKGQYADAEQILERLDPYSVGRLYCLTQLDRGKEVTAYLDKAGEDLDHYERCVLNTGLGDTGRALDHFEQLGWQYAAYARWDPAFDPLRQAPRYQAALAHYDFPPVVP